MICSLRHSSFGFTSQRWWLSLGLVPHVWSCCCRYIVSIIIARTFVFKWRKIKWSALIWDSIWPCIDQYLYAHTATCRTANTSKMVKNSSELMNHCTTLVQHANVFLFSCLHDVGTRGCFWFLYVVFFPNKGLRSRYSLIRHPWTKEEKPTEELSCFSLWFAWNLVYSLRPVRPDEATC